MDSLNVEETTVFFVNLYNILVLHVYMELEKFPSSIWDWKYMEKEAYYTIGGVAYSLLDIHHGILRNNKSPPGTKFIPFFAQDPRSKMIHQVISDPCIIFTLSNHTIYSPSVFRLEPSSLREGLAKAESFFCETTIFFKKHTVCYINLYYLLFFYLF